MSSPSQLVVEEDGEPDVVANLDSIYEFSGIPVPQLNPLNTDEIINNKVPKKNKQTRNFLKFGAQIAIVDYW